MLKFGWFFCFSWTTKEWFMCCFPTEIYRRPAGLAARSQVRLCSAKCPWAGLSSEHRSHATTWSKEETYLLMRESPPLLGPCQTTLDAGSFISCGSQVAFFPPLIVLVLRVTVLSCGKRRPDRWHQLVFNLLLGVLLQLCLHRPALC